MQITHNLVVAALTELGYAPEKVSLEEEFSPTYTITDTVYITTNTDGGWLLWLESPHHNPHCLQFGQNDFGLLLATVSRLYFS